MGSALGDRAQQQPPAVQFSRGRGEEPDGGSGQVLDVGEAGEGAFRGLRPHGRVHEGLHHEDHRGAKGITDQSDEDWEFLERGAITTLRNVTRVFFDDLAASDAGRFAMVSSTAVSKPTAGGASYVAAKSAAEAWTLAVADGFRKAQDNPGTDANPGEQHRNVEQHSPIEQHSAAVIFVVKALVDPAMRAKSPERTFPGFTDVEDLAAAAVGLFSSPAADLNGQRLLLGPNPNAEPGNGLSH